MADPIHILMIDDNPDDRLLITRQLRSEFPGVAIQEVAQLSHPELEALLARGGFDLVITDYQLGWSDGLQVLQLVKRSWPECPVIMFTGTGSEEIAVAGMKGGLDDYILKSPRHYVRLSIAVRSALERGESRRSAREANARWTRLFDGVPLGLFRTDPQGALVEANPALVHLLGCSDAGELIGRPLTDFCCEPAEGQACLAQAAATRQAGDQELRFRRRDGQVRWMNQKLQPFLDELDRLRYFEGSLDDITPRKQMESELRENEERYRFMFEESLTGNFVAAPDGRIVACNPAFTQIFHFESLAAARRHNFLDLMVSPEAAESLLVTLGRLGHLERHEMEMRNLGGQPVHVIGNIYAKGDEHGNLLQIHGYLFDDTQRRLLESNFRQSQKMDAIGRLAGGIAHDFNNYLTVITGFSGLLLTQLDASHPCHREANEIHEAGQRATALTRQLLALSRRPAAQTKTLNLNDLIGEMEHLMRRLAGETIELRLDLDANLRPVLADPGQIEQVIINLVINARDALNTMAEQGGRASVGEPGRLTIATSMVEVDESYLHLRMGLPHGGPFVALAVHDSGCGMDADTMAHLFEPFFTTKEKGKGTGLGLSMVYGIVRQCGGGILFRSELGRGTTCTIYLPPVAGAVPARDSEDEPAAPGNGCETILLVEDEEPVRKLIAEILKRRGYTVLQAESGTQALEVIGNHPGRIDLLLSDIVMPGMTGRELAQQLLRTQPGLRVLLISGYGDQCVAPEGDSEHADAAFLQKPFTPDALVVKIRDLFDDLRSGSARAL